MSNIGLVIHSSLGSGYWFKTAGMELPKFRRVWMSLNRGNIAEYLAYLHDGCEIIIDDYTEFTEDATPLAEVHFRVHDAMEDEWVSERGEFWMEKQQPNHPATLYGEW